MKPVTPAELWQRLLDEELVSGEQPPSPPPPPVWYVEVMLGAAGWLGALFILAAIGCGMAAVFHTAALAIPVGILCCVTAFVHFRAAPGNVFTDQFALAVSLTGQALFGFGMWNALHSRTPSMLALAAFEIVLAAALPNFTHRVLAAAAAAAALTWALPNGAQAACGVVWMGFALISLNAFAWARRTSLWRPVGLGLAIGMLGTMWMWGLDRRWRTGGPEGSAAGDPGFWPGNALLALVFLAAMWGLLRRERVQLASGVGSAAAAAALVVAVGALIAPGVAGALLVLVLGFANGERGLLALGLGGLGGYLIFYYYQLDVTLLVKSMMLTGTGAALLALRFTMRRWLDEAEAFHA